MSLSRPHGGKLVNRLVEGVERERLSGLGYIEP